MEKIKKNLNLIIYLLIICILTGVMFYFIDKKEGFHEDEIFSYGASNSTLGNTFIAFGRRDNIDLIMKDESPIKSIKNLIYYRAINPEEYLKLEEEKRNNKVFASMENKRRCY